MSVAKLMTNIAAPLYNFIAKTAKSEGKSKRQVIEEAITFYIDKKKKQKLVNDYKLMAQDEDYLSESSEMAAMGMDYYLTDVDAEV